jgi:putative sterol carrier protein
MENFLKLNLGEANPMALMMTGKVKVSGSVPLALKFTSLFFGS